MKMLAGLIGEKLTHSYSVEIHSLFYKINNMSAHYYLFEIDKKKLYSAVEGMKTLNIKGLNVTIPYKTEVMKCLDNISEEAKKIGAVNTITLENDKTHGYNTDYYGFKHLLKKNDIHIENKSVFILGSGGSAKAIYQVVLDKNPKEIFVVSRKEEVEGFEEAKVVPYSYLNGIKTSDIIINCTPVGMHPNVEISPVEKDILGKFKIAIDIIFNPKETLFLKYAKENGLKYVNGLYMLVAQAMRSEELWNNIIIEDDLIDEIYNEMEERLR